MGSLVDVVFVYDDTAGERTAERQGLFWAEARLCFFLNCLKKPVSGFGLGAGVIDLEELNMRIMGLDYGSRTVGVAVCDPLGITAQTVETITRRDENKLRQTLARIETLAAEYGVERIVLGYPKNMNNTLGDRAKKSEELKAALERRTGLPVVLWDERLTTVAAERVLMESGVRREHRKKSVDQIAAAMILQGYLDRMAMEKKDEKEAADAAESGV